MPSCRSSWTHERLRPHDGARAPAAAPRPAHDGAAPLRPGRLIALLDWLFVDQPGVFDRIGAPLLGLFPFIAMFVVTSITMLRERTTGTLERLMTLPLTRLGLLGGYGCAFALAASVQATLVSAVAFVVLGLDVAGRRGSSLSSQS